MSPLRYNHPGFDASDGEPHEVTTCLMAQNVGSLAVVRYTGAKRVVHRADDCSGPYSETAVVFTVEVLAVAAGAPLPRQIDVVSIKSWVKVPREGDTILVTLRKAREEWFVTTNLPVELNVDGDVAPVTGRHVTVEIPADFDVLHDEIEGLLSDFERQCPDIASRRVADAEFQRLVTDPRAVGCEPVDMDPQPCEDPDCDEYVPPPCPDDNECE